MAYYKDLKVWEKSMDMVIEIYKILENFPNFEKFALADQIRRCAISIPSNIAEGSARNSKKEFIQFLHISLGSLYELQTQLEIALRLNYINKNSEIYNVIFEIEKMLNSLIFSMKK